jgi:hypothetical protein
VKLPAGGVERALWRLFRFHGVEKGTALIIDPVLENLVKALLLREEFSLRPRMISPA